MRKWYDIRNTCITMNHLYFQGKHFVLNRLILFVCFLAFSNLPNFIRHIDQENTITSKLINDNNAFLALFISLFISIGLFKFTFLAGRLPRQLYCELPNCRWVAKRALCFPNPRRNLGWRQLRNVCETERSSKKAEKCC